MDGYFLVRPVEIFRTTFVLIVRINLSVISAAENKTLFPSFPSNSKKDFSHINAKRIVSPSVILGVIDFPSCALRKSVAVIDHYHLCF